MTKEHAKGLLAAAKRLHEDEDSSCDVLIENKEGHCHWWSVYGVSKDSISTVDNIFQLSTPEFSCVKAVRKSNIISNLEIDARPISELRPMSELMITNLRLTPRLIELRMLGSVKLPQGKIFNSIPTTIAATLDRELVEEELTPLLNKLTKMFITKEEKEDDRKSDEGEGTGSEYGTGQL